MTARIASSSATAPVASRSKAAAPKVQAADKAKRSPVIPEGVDDTPDFSDPAPVAPKASGKKSAPVKAEPVKTKPAGKKPAAKAEPRTVTVNYRLEKETPGAGQYQPVSEDGTVLKIVDSPFGAVYARKDLVGDTLPQTVTATFTF